MSVGRMASWAAAGASLVADDDAAAMPFRATDNQFQHRRFAYAIAANHGYHFARSDNKVEILDDGGWSPSARQTLNA